MAESSFARLLPNAPIERAAVNPPPAVLDGPATADDGVTYHALSHPAAREHGWSPPAPPPKSEEQLRDELVTALAAEQQAADVLAQAQGASERAERHVERCKDDLDRYSTIDDDLTSATIEGLRQIGTFSLPDSLAQRLGSRDIAAAGLAAARRASETLAADLVTAQARADAATSAVERVLCAILTSEASRLAEQHAALTQQAGAVATQLLSWNLWSANKGVVIPPAVREILAQYATGELARLHSREAWIEAASRLRADPTAEVRVYG